MREPQGGFGFVVMGPPLMGLSLIRGRAADLTCAFDGLLVLVVIYQGGIQDPKGLVAFYLESQVAQNKRPRYLEVGHND